jgi:diguanylate cyclase (GGDEF)-like protein
MLPRVLAVSGGDSVGVVLLDTDAPVHARVYTTSRHRSELPVARVTLDPDMIGTLHAAPNGLTVARCEEGRHSFLEPLRELGSEFFWIWPVHSGSRMLAALCVGFDETPAPAPRLAVRGGQFAARLAIAVANSEREEQLYRQAHFDVLTGLPNRLLFRDRLAQELATATAGLSRGALLYVDLDHFKKVNDTVGHGAGDQLLVIVAQRLRSCVKEGDTVSRLGGDEFTIILRNVSDPDGARTVADRVIESVQLPVNIAGRDHFVHASVGITLFPDDGAEIDTLMRNADLAMYRAKEAGRGRALFFDPRMTEVVAAVADSGLHRALKRREFTLFYQPQFAIADGHLAGVEALLRWHTPRDGMRHPHEFVPAAEASGLIVDIGAWVLEAACAQFSAWREQGIAPPRMAINVSAKQLQYMDFPRNVQRMLDKHGIPADMLELELTESVFADHVSRQTLAKLAELGVRLALDDFGTGYSSLNYLRQFPIHMVKIDRSFLEDVPENQTSATLAETIILMAHAFGKTVVGEGVETSAQLDFLRERGCDVAQGFYLSRPLTASAATELFGNGRSHRDEPSSERAAG